MNFRRPSKAFYLAVVPPLLLALDMVYENTVLSWNHGPQMIGFTMMHTVGIILLPGILASLVWCASTILVPIFNKRWNLGNIGGAVVICLLLTIASLSYGFWIKLFSSHIAAGPYAVEFLTYMSALGEKSAVEALLARGVPINASNKQGIRAVEAAENGKQHAIKEYLESKGGTDKRF